MRIEEKDGITLLLEDHMEVEQLFQQAERTTVSNERKLELFKEIRQKLSKHAAIEEQFLYPVVRQHLGNDATEEALGEHHDVKELLVEIEGAQPGSEEFDSALNDLIAEVRHHVEEEESDVLPRVQEAVPREQLVEMGKVMQAAKMIAPTRAHPNAPDTPPGVVVAGLASGVVDRARDVAEKVGDKLRGR